MKNPILPRKAAVLGVSLILTGCVSGIGGNHAAVERLVQKVFAYDGVPDGKVRDLRSPQAERLIAGFSPELQRKIRRLLKTETERPGGSNSEPDLWKRAMLVFDTDPLTNRSQKPDRIQISKPQIQGDRATVRVLDGYRGRGGWLGDRTADVILREQRGTWKIEEIYFRGLGKEHEPSRLSEILDSLTMEIAP